MSHSEKVPCTKCGVQILPTTAGKNDGLCFPCKNGTRGAINQRKSELKQAKEAPPEPEFICLECGSKQCRSEMHANTSMNNDDPWSMATSRSECWDCGVVMPRPLAHRWNNLSLENAKKLWVEKFRNDRRSRVKNA